MSYLVGLIILLVISLIIGRKSAARRRHAASRKFEQNVYEVTQDIRSRLSAVERRLEQLSAIEAPEPKIEPSSVEIAPAAGAAIKKVQPRVAAGGRADERQPVVSDRVAEGRIEELEKGEHKTSWVDEVVSIQKKELKTSALGEPSKSEPSIQTPSAKPPRKWTSLKPSRAEASGKPRPGFVDRISTQLRKVTERAPGEPIDWEALIGGSWLNVIGIVVLVVGMVLFSQHSLSLVRLGKSERV